MRRPEPLGAADLAVLRALARPGGRWYSLRDLDDACRPFTRGQVIAAIGRLRRRDLVTPLYERHRHRYAMTTVGEGALRRSDEQARSAA